MVVSYDVIILGGGIHGCAIARKLAQEGKKVCILERNTIGSGTSSNSSKLVHGGLRYLENGEFSLVRESLQERKRLHELYPDLVKMVPFYLPVYKDSPRPWWMIRMGLGIYDIFSEQSEYSCGSISNDVFAQRFAGIKTSGLERVYVYYDGKTDDLELTRRIAQEATIFGSIIKENCQVQSVKGDEKLFRVLYQDDSGEHRISAPVFIKATGPWIDEVNAAYNLPHNYKITKVSGIHIVINHRLVPDCMLLQTNNQQIFFMIPWKENETIIGTTDRIEDSPCDEVNIQQEDIDYLLNCANSYLRKPIDL